MDRAPIYSVIYIKSNPGTEGTGLVEDITYRNITASKTLWMPLWIGPQQQHQPAHAHGTGCSFLYPLVDTCPTQPLVTIRRIRLENVSFTDSYLLPGVILCDATNPCTDFTFTNVTNSGNFIVQLDYDCHNVKASTQTNTQPPFTCFT
jgi:hypothetical protein